MPKINLSVQGALAAWDAVNHPTIAVKDEQIVRWHGRVRKALRASVMRPVSDSQEFSFIGGSVELEEILCKHLRVAASAVAAQGVTSDACDGYSELFDALEAFKPPTEAQQVAQEKDELAAHRKKNKKGK